MVRMRPMALVEKEVLKPKGVTAVPLMVAQLYRVDLQMKPLAVVAVAATMAAVVEHPQGQEVKVVVAQALMEAAWAYSQPEVMSVPVK